jgi:hypothetical protein
MHNVVQIGNDKGQSAQHMSAEAAVNANSPAVGHEKSQDRAAERKATDHTNKGKHKGMEESGDSQ